jgi:hypothetical protein
MYEFRVAKVLGYLHLAKMRLVQLHPSRLSIPTVDFQIP